jgi:hypothetical protein
VPGSEAGLAFSPPACLLPSAGSLPHLHSPVRLQAALGLKPVAGTSPRSRSCVLQPLELERQRQPHPMPCLQHEIHHRQRLLKGRVKRPSQLVKLPIEPSGHRCTTAGSARPASSTPLIPDTAPNDEPTRTDLLPGKPPSSAAGEKTNPVLHVNEISRALV